MKYRYLLFICIGLLRSLTAQTQTTASITTLPLEVTAVCPGSVIAVPFTYTGKVGRVTVQISDGNSFTTIYTEPNSFTYPNDYLDFGRRWAKKMAGYSIEVVCNDNQNRRLLPFNTTTSC